MKNKKIFFEHDECTGTSIGLEYEKYLYHCQSKYQKIEIVKSSRYGNAMYLDGCFMLAERNADFYHNKCMRLVPNHARNILIIGGGDCAIASTLLIKNKVETIDVVEIDKKVIDTSRKYFTKYFNLSSNQKKHLNLIIEDGIKFVKEANISYDCIIIDSTDPVGIAKGLISKSFLKKCHGILLKKGVIIQQSGSPIKDSKKIINPMIQRYKEVGLINVNLHSFPMPLYPTGTWSFLTAERA